MGTRHCGDCQLCCKLLPMPEFAKPASAKCQYQKFHVGCKIYARRPMSCQLWSCLWLVGDDTEQIARPDRSHYVIDPSPDYITVVPGEGERFTIPVLQIWVDPDYKDAHRDPALRDYLARTAERSGLVALVRYNSTDGLTLIPPAMASDKLWHEVAGSSQGQHSFEDRLRHGAGMSIVLDNKR